MSAIAAGCAAVIKPSEATPHVNQVLAELLPKYVDKDLYHIVQGGIPETTKASSMLRQDDWGRTYAKLDVTDSRAPLGP